MNSTASEPPVRLPRRARPKTTALTAEVYAGSERILPTDRRAIREINRQLVDMPRSLDWMSYDDTWARLPLTEGIELQQPSGSINVVDRRAFIFKDRGLETIAHIFDRSDLHWDMAELNDVEHEGLVPTRVISLPSTSYIGTLRPFTGNALSDYLPFLSTTPAEGADFHWRTSVLADVLRALDYLHSRQLAHGDLRPENIIITEDGVRLVDYGLAVPARQLSWSQRLYRAPETRNGAKPRPFADIYSFARLAERLLGGYLWRTPSQHTERSWTVAVAVDVSASRVPARRLDAQRMLEVLSTPNLTALARTEPISTVARIIRAKRGSLSGARRLSAEFDLHPGLTLAAPSRDDTQRLASYMDLPNAAGASTNLPLAPYFGIINKIELPPKYTSLGIDDRWTEVAHERFFGYGAAPDRLTAVRALPLLSRQRKKQREFDAYVGRLSRVRANLIESISFLSGGEVQSILAGTTREMATETDLIALRRIGAILAVPDHGRYLYPTFQFSPAGLVSPFIQEASRVMDLSTEWEVLSWWYLPRTDFSGETLAAHLYDLDGSSVIRGCIDVMRDGSDVDS